MTREEAKRRMEICRDFLANNFSDMGEPNFTAFNMAIQALSQEPCDDAISRDMALEKMADYVASGYAVSEVDFEKYSRIICQLPSVTQKSGKWINTADACMSDNIVCSKCGYNSIASYNYCPNCGAKMETEIWNGYHGQITAPKGTFKKIYEDAESEE